MMMRLSRFIVHTEQPGNALSKGLEFGQLLTVKVENMKEQHKNVKSTKKKAEKEKFVPAEPENDFGFVAVAAGNGLKDLFKDLGCDNVVSGGQSMNRVQTISMRQLWQLLPRMFSFFQTIKTSFLPQNRQSRW